METKLPPGWEWKKLGEVCEIKPPKSEARNALQVDDFVSFLPMEDLGIDKKYCNPQKEKKLIDVEGSYTYFAENDVLLAKITPCFENGKLGIAKKLKNKTGFGSSEYIVFRPKANLFNEYLYYFLLIEKFRKEGVKRMTGASGHQRVLKDYIENTFIPIPPLAEQKRIVAILDNALESIKTAKENAEKNLANARELFDNYLNDVFSHPRKDWEEKKLWDACQFKPPKSEAKKYLQQDDYVSFIPMEDLGIDTKYCNSQKNRKLSEVKGSYTYFAENDVLLAKITPCFENGKLGIARNLINKVGFGSSEYIVFRPKSSLFNEYLFYFLSQVNFRNEGAKRMTGASGHQRVSKDYIENSFIPLPPFSEQKIIVKTLDVLSSQIKNFQSVYTQKITAINELKQSILERAFRGVWR